MRITDQVATAPCTDPIHNEFWLLKQSWSTTETQRTQRSHREARPKKRC